MIYGVHNYYVKVSGKSSDPSHNAFYISGGHLPPSSGYIETPDFEMCEWQTYHFHQADQSNSGHPFRFSDSQEGMVPNVVEFVNGVTISGVPGQAGASTSINILTHTSDNYANLFYYCSNHSGMGGSGYAGISNNAACGHEPFFFIGSVCSTGQQQGTTVIFKRRPEDTIPMSQVGGWPEAAVRIEYSGLLGGTGCLTSVEAASQGPPVGEVALSTSWYETCTDCWNSSCTIEDALSGLLSGLISGTNTALSGEYKEFEVTSYSITTGYNTGLFPICNLSALANTLADAELALDVYKTNFLASGHCRDDVNLGATGMQNINNITASVSHSNTIYNSELQRYESFATGYSDKEYYVTYAPTISGSKVTAEVDVNCPDTSLEVKLERDVYTWFSTGTAAKDDETIRYLDVTLNTSCTGYQTDLSARCNWITNGKESLCQESFFNGLVNCWAESDFDRYTVGSYEAIYKSGAFETSGSKYLVGTGELITKKYV